MPVVLAAPPTPSAATSARFLAILPRVQRHAEIHFRHVRCASRKDDAIAETVALAYRAFLRLVEQGRDPLPIAFGIAIYAARQVASGRRLCDPERTKDVLSPAAQRHHGFRVRALAGGQLADGRQARPNEQVNFRLDLLAWARTHPRRTRRLITGLMAGRGVAEVARRCGLTPQRVYQLRPELYQDLRRFLGDEDEPAVA